MVARAGLVLAVTGGEEPVDVRSRRELRDRRVAPARHPGNRARQPGIGEAADREIAQQRPQPIGAAPGRSATHARALAHQEGIDLGGRDPQHAARIPRVDASGEKPPGELLAGADRDGRQPALADQPLAVLTDELLNRRHHRGRLGRNGALGAQILKQRPHARSRQPPAIDPILGQEAAHRPGGELIGRERAALQPPSQVPQRDQRPDDYRWRVAAPDQPGAVTVHERPERPGLPARTRHDPNLPTEPQPQSSKDKSGAEAMPTTTEGPSARLRGVSAAVGAAITSAAACGWSMAGEIYLPRIAGAPRYCSDASVRGRGMSPADGERSVALAGDGPRSAPRMTIGEPGSGDRGPCMRGPARCQPPVARLVKGCLRSVDRGCLEHDEELCG
jgi:hypothetical protein